MLGSDVASPALEHDAEGGSRAWHGVMLKLDEGRIRLLDSEIISTRRDPE